MTYSSEEQVFIKVNNVVFRNSVFFVIRKFILGASMLYTSLVSLGVIAMSPATHKDIKCTVRPCCSQFQTLKWKLRFMPHSGPHTGTEK